MDAVDLLPVQLYLLALDQRRGRFTARSQLGPVLRAGALVELQHRNLIVDGERGRPRVTGHVPPAGLDPLLRPVLRQLAGSAPKSWQHWVRKDARAFTAAVRKRLLEDRRLREDRVRWLGLVPYTRVVLRDPRIRSRLERVARTTVAGSQPLAQVEPQAAALAALVAAGELNIVLPRALRRSARRRIAELGERVGPVPAALHKVVQAQQASTSTSV